MSFVQTYSDSVSLYDRLAPSYDRLHRRWLRHAGGEAQASLEAAVRSLATPTTNLLDVGCGTGAFARRLIAEGVSPSRMTLVDPSEEMLARCDDISATKINARLQALPFENASFDIVSCAWVLETLPDIDGALDELCRVLRPGGALCIAFCADRPGRGALNWVVRRALTLRGAGRFLRPDLVIETVNRCGDYKTISLPCAGSAFVILVRQTER